MDEKHEYYWIKLKTNFFELPEIDWLKDQENGCEYIVLYLQLCSLTANSSGELVRRVGEIIVPYDTSKIAAMTRFGIDTVVVALELFKKIGLVYVIDNGTLKIAGIERMVGAETKWAEKKRRQRLKKVDEGDNVPRLSPNCPPKKEDNVRQDIELDIELDIDKDNITKPPTNHKAADGESLIKAARNINISQKNLKHWLESNDTDYLMTIFADIKQMAEQGQTITNPAALVAYRIKIGWEPPKPLVSSAAVPSISPDVLAAYQAIKGCDAS